MNLTNSTKLSLKNHQSLNIPILKIVKLILSQIVKFEKNRPNIIAAKYSHFTCFTVVTTTTTCTQMIIDPKHT